MCFRVWSRSLVIFKAKLSATTVNNCFQLFPIFCSKELHQRCCKGLELNIVRWSTKILKGITPPPHPPMIKCHLGKIWIIHHPRFLDATKIHFQRFFTLSFLHLISNGLNRVNITHWQKLWLVKAHKHLI